MLPRIWAKRGGYSCSGSTLGRARTFAIRRQIDAVDRVLEAERGADADRQQGEGDEPDRAGQERDDQQDGRDAGTEPMAARVDHPRLRERAAASAGTAVGIGGAPDSAWGWSGADDTR